jgi:hypothetical protein
VDFSWTPPFWLRRLDLVREACRLDPAYGLPPEEKLDRIALLMGWGLSVLSEKAARRGVAPDQILREQAMRADRRRARGSERACNAVSIIEEQEGRLDEAYLDLWAPRLGVEQELAYVMRGGTLE